MPGNAEFWRIQLHAPHCVLENDAMPRILQLSRQLDSRPVAEVIEGIAVRTFGLSGDVDRWLAIRAAAFEQALPGARVWGPHDFEREFLQKPWWNAEHMWFAVRTCEHDGAPRFLPIGTVALARRGRDAAGELVILWLAVVPQARRLGVGRLLMAAAEAACWDAGQRNVRLETHAGWTAAVELYRSLGYVAG